LSGRALLGLDTRLNGPALPSTRTHPSRVAQNKKNIRPFPLESPFYPHPFSNPLSNRRHARTVVACSTATMMPTAKTWQRAALRLSAVAYPSYVPTATYHSPPSSSSRHSVVHGDGSGATFFTAPNPLPAACWQSQFPTR
jgi:hypothetical protein